MKKQKSVIFLFSTDFWWRAQTSGVDSSAYWNSSCRCRKGDRNSKSSFLIRFRFRFRFRGSGSGWLEASRWRTGRLPFSSEVKVEDTWPVGSEIETRNFRFSWVAVRFGPAPIPLVTDRLKKCFGFKVGLSQFRIELKSDQRIKVRLNLDSGWIQSWIRVKIKLDWSQIYEIEIQNQSKLKFVTWWNVWALSPLNLT